MSKSRRDSMFQNLFDAMPSIALVVDDDVRIQAYNRAAAAVLREAGERALGFRAGDAIACTHATDSPEGCGRGPLCHRCVLRNSVTDALRGVRTSRRRTRLDLVSNGEHVEMYALVTASPFEFDGRQLVLLVIEDISVIAELTRIIPICASCGRVRDGGDAWVRVESYFSEQWGVDFSHGLCPVCLDHEMKRLDARESESVDLTLR